MRTAKRLATAVIGAALGVLALQNGAPVLGAAPAGTAQEPQQQPAAPQGPDQYTFNSDTMMLAFTVVEAGATDFEVFMAKVKEAMTNSDKPERKQQAASWKMLLKIEPANNGTFTYIWVLNPVAKGVSYDLFKILAETLTPEEVKTHYDKVGPVIKGINMSTARIIGPS
jgi:hypothetical protein